MRISDWSSDVCSSDRNGGDIHCRLALCFVAKANHGALPARQGAFDSRGGPMKNGIKLLADNTYGRVEISNRKEFKHFNLRPSKKAVEEIERLEEMTRSEERSVRKEWVRTCRSRWSQYI